MTILTKTALAAAIAADVADNSSGDVSPEDIRSNMTDILDTVHGVYGSLECISGATPQSLDTTAAKLTAWAANGASNGTTPDHATANGITVGTDGVYLCVCNLQGTGATGETYTFYPAVGSTASATIATQYTAAGAETFTVTFNTLLALTAADVVSVYGKSGNAGGANYTLVHGQLTLYRVA